MIFVCILSCFHYFLFQVPGGAVVACASVFIVSLLFSVPFGFGVLHTFLLWNSLLHHVFKHISALQCGLMCLVGLSEWHLLHRGLFAVFCCLMCLAGVSELLVVLGGLLFDSLLLLFVVCCCLFVGCIVLHCCALWNSLLHHVFVHLVALHVV